MKKSKWSDVTNIWYNISIADVGEEIPNNYDCEKWVGVSKKASPYKDAKEVIPYNCYSRISLDGVASVNGGKYYIACYCGGLNGPGKWSDYMIDITTILKRLKNAYIINLDNDCCDDIWYLTVGYTAMNDESNDYNPSQEEIEFEPDIQETSEEYMGHSTSLTLLKYLEQLIDEKIDVKIDKLKQEIVDCLVNEYADAVRKDITTARDFAINTAEQLINDLKEKIKGS